MKKIDIKEITLVIVIVILAVFIFLNLFKDNKVTFITNSDYLYDTAIKYLMDNDDNIDKDKNNYKKFIDYKKFGIAEDKEYKYAYMWVLTDSYYVEDNKLIRSSGHSISYKFVFNKDTNKVIKYIIPEDGRGYKVSVKNMYPRKLHNKILNYVMDNSKLKKEVKNYYGNLSIEE